MSYTDDQVERAARAIADTSNRMRGGTVPWDKENEESQWAWREMARAGLEAAAQQSQSEMAVVKVLFVDQFEDEVQPPRTTTFVTVPRIGDMLVMWTNIYEVVRVDIEAGVRMATVYVRAGE